MVNDKSHKDFLASLEVLRHNLEGYNSGAIECYRAVSVELRKLLCDKNPLLPKIKPNQELHKLKFTATVEKLPHLLEGLELTIPGRLTNAGNSGYFDLTFATPSSMMRVSDWINQPFFTESISIKELIKSVADKEGAHSDSDYNDTLSLLEKIKFVDESIRVKAIIGIGNYILKVLE